MRIMRSIQVAVLAVAAGAGSAWAAGGVGGAAGAVSVAPHAATTTTATSPNTSTTASGTTSSPTSAANVAATGSAASTNASTLPPPPPTSVNPIAAERNTVPPTPAPATAGLPAPSASGALPSSQGLPAQVENELRPSPSLSADQVTEVQAALAAGGLYRGPIDGNMSGSLRASVRDFQQIVGLPQTGSLDAETLARLTRGTLVGGAGSNGTTSTAGNLNASQPFSTTFTGVPPTSTPTAPAGTATFSTPFRLSNPINTSPATPSSVLIQP